MTKRCLSSTTKRISHDVISARHFDSWWKKVSRETPDLLNFEKAC